MAGGRAWRAMRSPDGSAAAVPQPEEREEVVAVVGAKKVALERSVTRALPAALAASLASFDFDHDGTVDPRELEAAAALYQERGASLLSARRVLTLLALSLLGAVVVVVGMMFAVVELTRELSISSDGVLQVRPPPLPPAGCADGLHSWRCTCAAPPGGQGACSRAAPEGTNRDAVCLVRRQRVARSGLLG